MLLSAAVVALIALGVVVWARPLASAFIANLGAVEQSRVELSHYDPAHFNTLTLDQVRQAQNLGPAIELLAQAAQLDASNPTSHQRVAAIELSRGQYGDALSHMQTIWDAGYRDGTTRMLLGDAYIANGQPDAAAQVLKGLPWATSRLSLQAPFRYERAGDYRRAADAWSVVVQLNPNDAAAASAFATALSKVTQNK